MARLDTTAEFAALKTQFANLDADQQELKRVVIGLNDKMDLGFKAINDKLDARNKTPWPVIFAGLGFVLVFCSTLGGALYWPISKEMERLSTTNVRQWDQLNKTAADLEYMKGALRSQLK